jgi:hypothetical protein
LHKNRYEDQWNRIKDLHISPPSYAKSCQRYTMEKRQPLQQMLLRNRLSACRKLKCDPCLSPCSSINLKWIKDLNIRPETLKLVQKRPGNTLEAIGIGKDFLSKIQVAQN